MTDEETQPQIRRLSIYRQLSDVLKSKRKSYRHISPPNSTFTFVWNCALNEVKSSSKEDLKNLTPCLIKQKSISCDDVTILSTNEDEQTIDKKSKQNGLFEIFSFFFLLKIKIQLFKINFLFVLI
jgi:hypothetical protein